MYFINLELFFFIWLWPSKYFKANSIKKYSWTLIGKIARFRCPHFFLVTTEHQLCRNRMNSGNFFFTLVLKYKIIFKAAHSMHGFVHIWSNCIEWLHALFSPRKKKQHQSKIKCDIFVCFCLYKNHDSFFFFRLRVCFYKYTSTFTECA